MIVLMVVLAACGGGSSTAGGGTPTNAEKPTDGVPGQAVYETRCAPCHGPDGGGNGPAAAGLDPKPRNFRDSEFWRGRTPTQLRIVVKQGRPGTLMPPFEGALSDAQIDAVVAYLASFRPGS